MTKAQKPTADGLAAVVERIATELQQAKDNIAQSAESAGGDLAAQLRRLQEDLGAIQQTVTGLGKVAGAEAGGAASRIGAAGADAARDFADSARKEARSAIADAEAFARKNPGVVLGGALGLGLVLGLLLRRR